MARHADSALPAVVVRQDGAPARSEIRAGAGPLTGLRLLLPFARNGCGRYIASALLALAGSACQLVPYWAVYCAVRAVVDGTATWGGLGRLAVLAAAGVLTMTMVWLLVVDWRLGLAALSVERDRASRWRLDNRR